MEPRSSNPFSTSALGHSTKPSILYDQPLYRDRNTHRLFRKRHTKYVHQIYTDREAILFSRTLKQLKVVHIVDVERTWYGSPKDHLILKALKPLRKQIQSMTGETDTLMVHLPYVSQYQLIGPRAKSWKGFLGCPNIKQLSIDWLGKELYGGNVSGTLDLGNIIERYRARFRKRLASNRSPKHLTVSLQVEDKNDFVIRQFMSMFSAIIPYTQNMEIFAFKNNYEQETFAFKNNCQQAEPPGDIKEFFGKLFDNVTHLDISNSLWLTLSNFNRLASLSFNITPSSDMSHLAYLKALHQLRKLELSVTSKSYSMFDNLNLNFEYDFMEYFSLPKRIESVKLTCGNWGPKGLLWCINTMKGSDKFYSAWEELENLKDLRLTIVTDSDRSSEWIAFSFLAIVSCLKNSQLQTFSYEHIYYDDYIYRNFKNFSDISWLWSALIPSSKTLETISIKAPGILLSDLQDQRTKMPNLKTLTVQSQFHQRCTFDSDVDEDSMKYSISELQEACENIRNMAPNIAPVVIKLFVEGLYHTGGSFVDMVEKANFIDTHVEVLSLDYE